MWNHEGVITDHNCISIFWRLLLFCVRCCRKVWSMKQLWPNYDMIVKTGNEQTLRRLSSNLFHDFSVCSMWSIWKSAGHWIVQQKELQVGIVFFRSCLAVYAYCVFCFSIHFVSTAGSGRDGWVGKADHTRLEQKTLGRFMRQRRPCAIHIGYMW